MLTRLGKRALTATARHLGVESLFRKALKRRLRVLCYHAVLSEDHPSEPYRTRTAVSIRDFREHLQVAGRFFKPVSATDVLESLHGTVSLPPRALLITFDDGLRNNLTCAAPELERQGIPALIHLPTGFIGNKGLLWTHEVDERILAWKAKTLPMPDSRPDLPMPTAPEARFALAEHVKAVCKRLPDAARSSYLDRLRIAPAPILEAWQHELYSFLSWDEVRTLTRRGFAVGSHTVGHPVLSRLTTHQLARELRESKATIEREIGRPCPWIAYPNGGSDDYSPQVLSEVREAGYRVGFTLKGRLNARAPAPLEVDRICVTGGTPVGVFRAKVSGLFHPRTLLSRQS